MYIEIITSEIYLLTLFIHHYHCHRHCHCHLNLKIDSANNMSHNAVGCYACHSEQVFFLVDPILAKLRSFSFITFILKKCFQFTILNPFNSSSLLFMEFIFKDKYNCSLQSTCK